MVEEVIKIKKVIIIALIVIIIAVAGVGVYLVTRPAISAEKNIFKIRTIVDSPVTDPIGHMQFASLDEAKSVLETDYPNMVFDVDFKEEVSIEDLPSVVESLSEEGTNLIFTNLAESDIVWSSAQKHPDIFFMEEAGTIQEANLSSYDWKWNEGQYVSGVLSGNMTKTKKVGFIQAIIEPGQIAGANSFYQGIKSVDPEIDVLVAALGNWYDPVGVETIGGNMIALGADILYSVSSGLETLAQRKEEFYLIGNFVDWVAEDNYYADYQLVALLPRTTPFIIEAAEKVIAGTWEAQNYWWGVGERKGGPAFSYSPYYETPNKIIPESVKTAIEELKIKISNGEIQVEWLTEPIY